MSLRWTGGEMAEQMNELAAAVRGTVYELCDTCEALRAEVERLRAEVETWVKVAEVKNRQLDAYDEKAAQAEMVAIERSACQAAMQKMDDLRVVAEAALARAEQAERERDDARVRYCREVAKRGWESPREVCERVWPDAADALFPEVRP